MSKYRHQINALLLKIKAGDNSKMADVFNLTSQHLKYVALYYLFDKCNFEDAVNEAYYRALKYIQNFNVFKDGYNWLCRIVQNVAMDMNKENGQYVLCEDLTVDDFDFSDEIDRMLNKDALYRFIKTLPQFDRKLIYYRFFLDLTYAEIAKKLNSAKSQVHNRIKIISKQISDNFEI